MAIRQKDQQLIDKYIEDNPDLDFYCPLPFSHFSSSPDGRYKPCCVAKAAPYTTKDKSPLEFFNCDVMNDLRRDLKNGEITDHVQNYCKRCLITEAQSGHSKRIAEMKKHKRTYKTGKFNSVKLKLFGNFCNLKCVMCAPLQSSKWASEIIEHGPLVIDDEDLPERAAKDVESATAWPIRDFAADQCTLSPFAEMDQEKFYRDMEYIIPRLKTLEFTGGEPLINSDILDFIKWIIKKKWSKKLQLKFITNGTCFAKDLTFLSEFKKVKFSISVDGVGAKDEYLRAGTKFDQLRDNILRYKSIENLNVIGNTCITALNIGYLDEIFEFCESADLPFGLSNILVGPRYMRALNLPESIKRSYKQRLEQTRWADKMSIAFKILDMPEDLGQFKTMLRYLEALDLRRRTSLKDLWPEFYSYDEGAEVAAAPAQPFASLA